MFKFFRTIPGKLRRSMSLPHLPKLKTCHRVGCPCVSEVQQNMINVIRTSEGYQKLEESKIKYKKCYDLSKKWGHAFD